MDNRVRDLTADGDGSAIRTMSTGRGGAGNIHKERSTSGGVQDLVTPTIKADTYTTGRGGTGNMARNHPSRPEIARASQDVEAPIPRENEAPFHIGRGGVANIAKGESSVVREQNKHKSLDPDKLANDEKESIGEKILHKVGIVGKK